MFIGELTEACLKIIWRNSFTLSTLESGEDDYGIAAC